MQASSGAGHFIGIDVQSARHSAYAVLDRAGELVESGWLAPADGELEARLASLSEQWTDPAFGIDAPRAALAAPRDWFWRAGRWRRRSSERGAGRHCEVVVKAHGLANPQWTPLAGAAPAWMEIGFRIFRALERFPAHEVFPSASYALLPVEAGVRGWLRFDAFRPGAKDALDAVAAAHTVFEFEAGRGCEVGGGDGLGTIVLPRPLPAPIAGVLAWPGAAP